MILIDIIYLLNLLGSGKSIVSRFLAFFVLLLQP